MTRYKYVNLNQMAETYLLPCPECDTETRHAVLQSVQAQEDTEDGLFWCDLQIVQCLGCETFSFRKATRWSEDSILDGEGSEKLVEHEDLYPHRLKGRKELPGVYSLPVQVRSIYRETQLALVGKQPVLAGVGIRAIVETVCKDKGAKGKNLEAQIDGLVSISVLTPDGAEILHGTRLMGNKAAHEVKAHTIGELSAALDVVEHLLVGVYILKEKARILPARTQKK